LRLANRIIAHEGVLDGFGHYQRAPSRTSPITIIVALAQPGAGRARDILELDADFRGGHARSNILPYGECVIHGEIFRARPDVTAIVHHHSQAILPFCLTDLKLRAGHGSRRHDGAVVPSWDSAHEFGDTPMVLTTNGARRALARALGRNRHGADAPARRHRGRQARCRRSCSARS
jgi:hypothetical protein